MTRKPPLILRIDDDLKRVIREEALRENRSINNLVETILLRHLGLEMPLNKKSKPREALAA
jgi:hypothetical protein